MTRAVAASSRRRGTGAYTAWRRGHLGASVSRRLDGSLLVELALTGSGPTVDVVLEAGDFGELARWVEAELERRQMAVGEPRSNSPEDIGWRRTG